MATLSSGSAPCGRDVAAEAGSGAPGGTLRLDLPARAMGLDFANALGIAAGIDKTGARLAELARTGVGHVEVGTLTAAAEVTVDRKSLPDGLIVGLNFASPRSGLDAQVVDDYAGLLRACWHRADYLVANLSSPTGGRHGDTPRIGGLISRLAEERRRLVDTTGISRPLLIKVGGGPCGSRLPRAILAARRARFDGVVLASPFARRLEEIRPILEGAVVISVGGVATTEEASARRAAGAALVQIHTAFQQDGARAVQRLLGSADRSATW